MFIMRDCGIGWADIEDPLYEAHDQSICLLSGIFEPYYFYFYCTEARRCNVVHLSIDYELD